MDLEHRKQLLIQQIDHHRELMRLEMKTLRETDPVRPVVAGGRRLLGLLGGRGAAPGSGGDGTIETGAGSLELELLRRTLPAILPVLRALLRRHRERRPRKKGKR